MTQTIQKENKMGYMPIPKLLFQMGIPIIISMLVQALYNIVDSIFVAQISEDALTAVSLVFPIQNLLISIAVGTGVGVNALLSRSLGEREYDKANQSAMNGIFLAIISSIVCAVACIAFARYFLTVQTNNTDIQTYGIQYMSIVGGLCFGIFMQITFERLLQATGKTFFVMISQGTGAIINIIFDPILIFGLLGFPEMGVAGAAIATVFGQFCGTILALIFNLKYNPEIKLRLKGFRPNLSIIKGIYIVGFPSIIMQAIGSVMTFGFNKILLQFTSTAAAVFGIYFKLNSFIFMPVFGLNNAMVPIIAFNYGARNKSRIMKTIKLSVICATVIMLIGASLFLLIPQVLLGFFQASPQMLEIGIPALRTICLSFIFAGYCIIIGSVFQALGNGMYSLIVSFVRQILAVLPLAALLSRMFGLNGTWWSFPLAEIASLILTTILFIRINNKLLKPLDIK